MNTDFKIALIDYGRGNLRSIKNALMHIGNFQVNITKNPDTIINSDCIILPGVGAYPGAMKSLKDRNLITLLNDQVVNREKPLLGVCLGMQLLFNSSTEGGENIGLGWIPGKIEHMNIGDSYRVPHVGWNNIQMKQPSTMFERLGADKNFYFVHS